MAENQRKRIKLVQSTNAELYETEKTKILQ